MPAQLRVKSGYRPELVDSMNSRVLHGNDALAAPIWGSEMWLAAGRRLNIGRRLVGRTATVTVVDTFDAAHRLPFHRGRCANLHGHTYRLEVSVTGLIGDEGMVIDFADLRDTIRLNVLDTVDHSFLNDIIDNPTAENIAVYLFDRLESAGLGVTRLRLWETPSASVTINADD